MIDTPTRATGGFTARPRAGSSGGRSAGTRGRRCGTISTSPTRPECPAVCSIPCRGAVARIEYDHDTSPRDYDQPGWCFDTTSRKYGKQNRKIIAAWEADEWFYCGIVVTVFREGVKLGEAHLWGIEANFPFGKQKTRHAYHLTVANELLDEALDGARETIRKLAASIAA
jgi:hypothetical protein